MLASRRNTLSSLAGETAPRSPVIFRSSAGLIALSCAVFACGSKRGTSQVEGAGANSGSGSTAGSDGNSAGSGFILPDGGGTDPDGGGVTDLTIAPANPVLDVHHSSNGTITSITGGADSMGTVAFQASSGGMVVPAKWSIDRGELGALDVSGGNFVPNGKTMVAWVWCRPFTARRSRPAR